LKKTKSFFFSGIYFLLMEKFNIHCLVLILFVFFSNLPFDFFLSDVLQNI
jgi:hypothetical protein